MKFSLILWSSIIMAGSTRAAFFTNSPDADAFVRAAATNSNYGAAGALSVSGANATNSSGVIVNGAFDSFIRFNTAAMATNFNAVFGANNWAVSGARLVVTEIGAPPQTIFNRGKGAFEIRWIANTNWIEGTGTPMIPTTDGIVYTNETTLLNSNTDASLGVFTNAGVNAVDSFKLVLPAVFTGSLAAGGEVDLFLTAADLTIGFTMDSQNFGTASARPFLIISAVPQPGISAVNLSGTNVVLAATNGVAGGTYYVLSSTNLALPLAQWTPVATNVPAGNGNFGITVTNAASAGAPAQHFFILQTQ
jgi:hypothetical protein